VECALLAWIQRWTNVDQHEAPAVGWSFVYILSLFLAYYVLRPIRDEAGLSNGLQNLPWLISGTFLAIAVASPLFALLVRRYARDRFIVISYRFFSVNLMLFAILFELAPADMQRWIDVAFFIWLSVFNLFVVSVFWSLMVDIFDAASSQRLFGLLAAGATLGGLLGSALTASLAQHVGRAWLVLIAIGLMEAAVMGVRNLLRVTPRTMAVSGHRDDVPVGGSPFAGMTRTFSSPYLAGIALFIVFYSMTSTIMYFQQVSLAAARFSDAGQRTAFFASIDLWVGAITLVIQIVLTGRLFGWTGLMTMLCALPLVSIVGFAALAACPTVSILIAAQAARRISNFAMARPAREVLFTSSSREDRYKAKNFIDTVLYRSGDQVASWSYAGLMGLGLCMMQIAVIAVPLSFIWLLLSIWLGRAHLHRQAVAQHFASSVIPEPNR
jgi:ATP:ADP antiporter, AAA family